MNVRMPSNLIAQEKTRKAKERLYIVLLSGKVFSIKCILGSMIRFHAITFVTGEFF